MKLSVTSFRGHHEAVCEPEVARQVFERLTGKRKEPLEAALKVKIPDTWAELNELWNGPAPAYTAISKDAKGELIGLKEFNPDAAEVTFLAPITGG